MAAVVAKTKKRSYYDVLIKTKQAGRCQPACS